MGDHSVSPRKSIGPKLGRQWNTPGTGELKWISISSPLPTADTRYDNTLRKRSGELKDEADFVPPGLDTLKDFDQKRRRANRRSAKKYGTTNGSRGKETKAWTVNIQEKQYKRNAFFDKHRGFP